MAGFSEAGSVNAGRAYDSDPVATIGASPTVETFGYETKERVGDVEYPIVHVDPNPGSGEE